VFIGVVICSVLSGRRIRQMVLRSNGEVVPCTSDDIQYVLPRTLIPSELMDDAFGDRSSILATPSPELDADTATNQLKFRRKIARSIRAVEISLELAMKTLNQNPRYDASRIWEHFSEQRPAEDGRWGDFTLEEVVEFLQAGEEALPHDLDRRIAALAVFRLLMDRSDLFLGDEVGMRMSQRFSIRPAEEVSCLNMVSDLLKGFEGSVEKRAEIATFHREVQTRVRQRQEYYRLPVEQRHQGTIEPFSDISKAFISIVMRRLVERRSTQLSVVDPLVPNILRASGLYEGKSLDLATAERFLKDIGEISPWDSLSRARIEAAEARDGIVKLPETISFTPSRDIDSDGLLLQDSHENIRRDFGSTPVYVIDAPEAQELDDGISIESQGDGTSWVHIHIADPTRWLSISSEIARIAERRGESLYYAEGGRPMIPSDEGSAGIMSRMSLGAAANDAGGQPTLSFSVKLSDEGSVLDYSISPGMIKNVQRMTYQAVNSIIHPEQGSRTFTERVWTLDFGNDSLKETYETSSATSPVPASENAARDLSKLNGLAKQLRQRRLNTQGLDYGIPQPSVGIVNLASGSSPFYEDKGLQYRTMIDGPTSSSASSDMVAEFMVLAGRISGTFASERRLALPYRGTGRPYIPSYALSPGQTVQEALQAFFEKRKNKAKSEEDMYDYAAADIIVQAAPVSITPLDHWSLGVHASDGGYSRVTSPLRRFSDMIGHWQIKHALSGSGSLLSPEDMLKKVSHADRLSQRARRMGKTAESYWQMTALQWMHKNSASSPLSLTNLAAKVLEAPLGDAILGISDKAGRVYIPELRIVAALKQPVYKAVQVKDDVRVSVSDVTVSPIPRITVQPV
jgi:exoribonuclease-2